MDWPFDRLSPVPDVPLEIDTGVDDGTDLPYGPAVALGVCWSRSDVPAEDWERSI